MADYADDFRDNYKNLRQSNDQKLKLNGATFRSIRNWSKIGNLISKTEVADAAYDERLDELEQRYDLAQPEVVYSLNKKKRWEVGPKLVSQMRDFDLDDQDVRLYETRNRYQKKANCIAVHRSKGDKLAVKSTYANIDSIKRAQELKEQAELNPKPAAASEKPVKQTNSKKKPAKFVKSIVLNEEILIDENPNRAQTKPYIQYDIEYSPKRDILKYGAKKVNSTGAISGSRSKKVQLKQSVSEDDIYYDEEEEDQEDEYYSDEENEPKESDEESDDEIQVPLEDLIYNYARMLLEKQEKSQLANKQKIKEEEVLGAKDKKIFVNKGELLQFQTRNAQEENNASAARTKIARPIPNDLLLDSFSIEPAQLKETFGERYSEATNCWPRHFNINLSKQIADAFRDKHGFKRNIDVTFWLTFQQNVDEASLEKDTYTVSACSNLICKKIDLNSISTENTWRIQSLCQEVVDLVANLHIDSFSTVESTATPGRSQFQVQSEDLPNIAPIVVTKNVDELKLEMINKNPSPCATAGPSFERMNSREVTKTEQDVLELEKIQGRLDRIFGEKHFECAICYAEQDSLQDCVIIKSCGHGVCKSCVKSYVGYELKNAFLKAGKFSCPSCDNEIGLALLINFATNAREVDVYIQKTLERIYSVLSSYKWCPSNNCSNILQVDLTSNPHGTISCSCGFQMCLKCNNKPHFPARCSQIANYYRQLKAIDEFDFDATFYHSRGKKCPMCHVFMEKNGGCNQMTCTMCKQPFCWNCVQPWKEHLKLTNGQHGCTMNETSKNVTVKVVNVKKVADKFSAHERSFVHRRMRKHEQRKARAEGAKRLLASIKQTQYEELYAQSRANENNAADQVVESKTETIIEKGNAFAQWRKETRIFLDNVLLFVNELHFVCEHGHLSLKDAMSKDARLQLSAVIKSLEIIIWGLEYNLTEGKGLKSIHQLRQLYDKGLSCIATLKKIQLD